MNGPYKVNRSTRRCAAADRPLQPGEWYYSVITGDDEQLVRRDYAAKNWDGPPPDAIGFWRRRMPEAGPKKLVPAPPAVLVDLLRQLESFPERSATRFMLALLLLRKRLVEPLRSDHRSMTLRIVSDGDQITIAKCEITPQQSAALASSLEELLYAEESSEDDETEDADPVDLDHSVASADEDSDPAPRQASS